MIPSGYKQTEIGVIPEDWEVTSFGQVGDYYKGGGISMRDVKPTGFPCIMYGDIYVKFDTHFKKCDYHIDSETAKNSVKASPQDIFFTASGETADDIGRCVSYQGKDNIYIGGDIIALHPSNEYDSLFLAFVQNSENVKKQKAALAQGHSVVHISAENIKKTRFAAPKYPEQRRIAEALSDVDELISSLEKLIEKKKAIKQGVMQELLTGKRRLSGFMGEWRQYRVGDMGVFYSGLSGKNKADFECGSSKYITFLNVLSNTIIDTSILGSVNIMSNEKQNQVKKGDLFFNTSSETPNEVGMCSVLNTSLDNTYLNSFCFGYRLKDDAHCPLFLSYYFNSFIGRKIMRNLAQGATRYNLSKNNFADTLIKLPQKNEQLAISSVLLDSEKEISSLRKKLAKIQKFKYGMMSELLTGRIRLM